MLSRRARPPRGHADRVAAAVVLLWRGQDRALVRVRQRPPLPAAVDARRERRRESPRAEQRVGPFLLQSMLLAPARRWLAGLLVRSPFHLSPTRFGQAVAHAAAAVERVERCQGLAKMDASLSGLCLFLVGTWLRLRCCCPRTVRSPSGWLLSARCTPTSWRCRRRSTCTLGISASACACRSSSGASRPSASTGRASRRRARCYSCTWAPSASPASRAMCCPTDSATTSPTATGRATGA
mmetsp:Transcript_21777/g.73445  ORF Transcript_21777/g.73445 Transcript_21777/m.73445 type:complete len:239 (-) Transcript_21777:706-1422(-)